ncbi:MAG TPA: CCA tRNA nucleotidyltransferase [Oligoflexia bacterium]|nr:CCA tRNA nucleotidyltransferase [Oligoflexia bacterium]HMP27934.1 CCA tRNA nucleotidyltransferase [Oligoflexia bacterium]
MLSKIQKHQLQEILSTTEVARLLCKLNLIGETYLVGGVPRDLFSEKKLGDFDLTINASPKELLRLLAEDNFKVYETGLKHGTITVNLNGRNIEITSFRKVAADGKVISGNNLAEDLKARDFTINAIAINPFTYEVIDPEGGINDLKNNLLKACGDPKARLLEDPLRIMRMIRFGPAADRKIDPTLAQTASLIADKLKDVSSERVREEFSKILLAPSKSIRASFMAMRQIGILQTILPEIVPSFDFEQNKFHTEDVFEHTITVIANAPPELKLRLAALFHDLGKPASLLVDERGERHFYNHEIISESLAAQAMARLKYSKDLIKKVTLLVRLHMRPLDCGPAGVRRLMRDLGEEFETWQEFKIADKPPVFPNDDIHLRIQRFRELASSEIARLTKSNPFKLAVNGEELKKIGFKQGRELGSCLKELKELVLDQPELNTKESLIKIAKEKLDQIT